MLPLTVVTGILLGCSVSITIGLGVVVFLFALNMGEHPQIQAEFPTLVVSVVLFAIMTVVCGLSFIALIRRHAWRWHAQAAMWSGVVYVFYYYWPD